jgi:hypothetical protein
MTNVNQMAKDVFSQAVKEAISELRTKALNAGVPNESIEAVISGVYTQAGNYSFTMAVRKIQSAVNNLIRAASAETLMGVIVGSRDKVGKNSPIRYTLLTTDKKHLEISNFGTTVAYQDQKMEIPVPALVTIRAEHDAEFDSWTLVALEKFQTIETVEQLAKILAKVAIPVSAIDANFAYKHGEHSGRPVVLSGTIGRISAEAVFRYEEDTEGTRTSTLDHHLPVYCARELDKESFLPCLQFNLNSKTRGTNSARCHIQQMRHATPNLLIPDIASICKDAADKIREPEGQATAIMEWLYDLPVIVIGVVDRYKRTVSEAKSEQNWIDIGVTCVVCTEGMSVADGGVQKTLDQKTEKPASAPHMTTQTEPIAGPITKTEGPAAPKKKGAAKPAAKKEVPPEAPAETPAPAAPAAPMAPPKTPPVESDDLADQFSKAADESMEEATQPVASKTAPKTTAMAPISADIPTAKINEIVRAIKFFSQISGLKLTDITVKMLREKALDIVGDIPDSIIEAAIIRAGKE